MTSLVVAGAALITLGIGAPALSADVPHPVKAPRVASIAPSPWDGFYLGVQGGAGWGRAREIAPSVLFDSGSYDVRGGLLGVTWGQNWQIGRFVVGLESDLAYSWIRGSTAGLLLTAATFPCSGVAPNCAATLRWLGTSRARFGPTFDRWFLYLTGGLAYGTIRASQGDVPANGIAGSGSETLYGWTFGGGAEAILGAGWSAKLEYLHVDLRDGRIFVGNVGFFLTGENVDFRTHIVRGGLNYRFDPLAALLPANLGFSSSPASSYSWTGFYLGGTGGGGFGTARQVDNTPFDSGNYRVGGAIAGVTAGYDWRLRGVALGLAGDVSWASIKGRTEGDSNTGICNGNPSTCASELQWLATGRARAGLPWGGVMPYVTGGVALGSLHGFESGLGSGTKTRFGWTVGGGADARINARWSSTFEYLYVDLGNRVLFTDTFFNGNTADQIVRFNTHIIRAGVNYRFGEGAVVAKH